MLKKIIKKLSKNELLTKSFAWIMAKIVSFIQKTSNAEILGEVEALKKYVKENKSVIVVFWHARSMMMTKFWKIIGEGKFNPVAGLTSVHRDGQFMAKILENLGLQIIEGSSTKGGVHAFMAAVKKIKDGVSLAITPDGPKGPRQRMGEGFLQIARSTAAPIFLVGLSASKAKFFNSWDRYMFVKPFSKCLFEIAGPYFIDRKIEGEKIEIERQNFEKILNQMSIKLDEILGNVAIYPQKLG